MSLFHFEHDLARVMIKICDNSDLFLLWIPAMIVMLDELNKLKKVCTLS